MKNVLEETASPQRSYGSTMGIFVVETSGMKGSFWLEILETKEKIRLDTVRSQADNIHKDMYGRSGKHKCLVTTT